MPRKRGTNERFTGISIEQKTFDHIHHNKLPGETLYQTAHRLFHRYHGSELEAAHFMLNEYEQVMQRQKKEIDLLKLERNKLDSIERYT